MRETQQHDLFSAGGGEDFPIQHGMLRLFHNVVSQLDAQLLFKCLRQQIHWRQDSIHIAGRVVPIPRLQAWYGNPGTDYSYSGLTLSPEPWADCLLSIKTVVETLAGVRFNSVLLNLYRDGHDSMGWHSDDEPELGPEPVIASLSLGACRSFVLRHKPQAETEQHGRPQKLKIALPCASLLVMSGRLQQCWQHQLPKTRLPVGERINLTFRTVQSSG